MAGAFAPATAESIIVPPAGSGAGIVRRGGVWGDGSRYAVWA